MTIGQLLDRGNTDASIGDRIRDVAPQAYAIPTFNPHGDRIALPFVGRAPGYFHQSLAVALVDDVITVTAVNRKPISTRHISHDRIALDRVTAACQARIDFVRAAHLN